MPCGTVANASRSEGPGVRSARSLFEPGEGLEEHERGGGGHFSPRFEGSSASQAPQLHSFAGFFFDQKPNGRSRQAGSQGEDLRSHGFDLRRYGGEGKTASSDLRNASRRIPDPFPGPLSAPRLSPSVQPLLQPTSIFLQQKRSYAKTFPED